MRPTPVLLMVRELVSGGTERQLTQLARFLDRSLFEVHVGCFFDDGFRARELRSDGIPVVRFPVGSFRSISTIKALSEFRAYLHRHRIALVHTFDYPMNTFGVPAARAFGIKAVLSSQRGSRSLVPAVYRHILRLTDTMVDGLVVNCEYLRQYLTEQEKVRPGLMELCYNGIDTSEFHPCPTSSPKAGLVIGIVSVLRAEKSIHTLVDAFARVRNLIPGLKLMIVGNGAERTELETRAGSLGILPQCVWEPDTADVANRLRAIDIFVLPSITEALSNSLMEAMACQCCPVASAVGGNPELVEDGSTGMLFRVGDAADLAGKLRTLIEQQDLRRSLAAAAAARIQARFSIQIAAARMGEIYEKYL